MDLAMLFFVGGMALVTLAMPTLLAVMWAICADPRGKDARAGAHRRSASVMAGTTRRQGA
jgi:hypothetical protein